MLYTFVLYCVVNCNDNDTDLVIQNLTKPACEQLVKDIKSNYAFGGRGTVVSCYQQGAPSLELPKVEKQ